MNYYNEFDPFAAAWLRELIAARLIPDGFVDDRSIEDVRPNELSGYTQCHFFAGIGGWPLALRLAGIPDDFPIWTGSCPCQPFSAAGKGAGFDDERHLWPAFQWLIQQCRPSAVAGEQVASTATGPWFDLVQADLEAMGYAFGLVAVPAAGIGAPHIRDRAFWVADAGCSRSKARLSASERGHERQPGVTHNRGGERTGAGQRPATEWFGAMANSNSHGCKEGNQLRPDGQEHDVKHGGSESSCGRPGPTNGFWRDADWLLCRDGKWRPVEPGTFPLVDGLPRGLVQSGDISLPSTEARAQRLKGYGNAIVPQVAAEFLIAWMEAA